MSRNFEVPNGHAIEIMEFLARPAGQSLMTALQAERPSLGGTNFEERAINSGVAEGWEACMEKIYEIAEARAGGNELLGDRPMNPSLADDRDPKHRPQGL